MKFIRMATALGLVVLLGACGDDLVVPDLNNAGLEELVGSPTPVTVRLAAQGLMFGAGVGLDGQGGQISVTGVFGRESLVFDPADPRWIDEFVLGDLDAGAFGAFLWGLRYDNIRLAVTLLDALERVAGFSDAELEAIRGFTKTIWAHDLLLLINARDTNGAVTDPNPFGEELAPIQSKDAVFNRIDQLLGEAVGHLQAGGDSFPFRLSSGYTGFDTPSTFIAFIRALQARVAVYEGEYGTAMTHLGNSFLDEGGDFDLGVYQVYGTAQGQNDNDLFQGADPNIAAFPGLDDIVESQPGGEFDARFTEKVDTLDTPLALQGVSSDLRFRVYPDLTSPIPLIRNEELILLRAEARWFTDDVPGALEDLNRVRTAEGELEELTLADIDTEDEFIDRLLYERTFSLLHEGGHRWIDHRRFGRLDELPNLRPGDQVPTKMPIPRDECLARGLSPTAGGGCG